jgi:hypothetical protein
MQIPSLPRPSRPPRPPGKRHNTAAVIAGGVVLVVALVALITGGFGAGDALYTPEPQHITVVRHGAFWQDRNIAAVVPPGAGLSWIGLYASTHVYPDSTIQRYYTITSDPNRGDRTGVDVVNVPTQDGVQVGIEGTFYLTTGFDGSSQGETLVRSFDERFGTRTFLQAGTGNDLHAWDGDAGWSAFLDNVVRPVIDNELRTVIGSYKCSDLNAACALVANANANASTVAQAGQQSSQNIQAVENAIGNGLDQNLRTTLGGDFFTNVGFRLSRVTLPPQLQNAVTDVQAARVEVATAQAKVQQAQKQNQANALLAQTYDTCAACAQIDAIKALPQGASVYFGVQPVVTAQPIANKK